VRTAGISEDEQPRQADGAGYRLRPPHFECGNVSDILGERLLAAQRGLRDAPLAQSRRVQMQRRLAAICDAMKAPGADPARIAWRLDRLSADVSAAGESSAAGECGERGGDGPVGAAAPQGKC